MKRDAAIAVAVVLIVVGVVYGLAAMKLQLRSTPPAPYSTAAVGPHVSGNVIIRVNGEAVTEDEFVAAYSQLPEETQRQLSSPAGKSAFAEQLVRYKLLEQEARRQGIDKDKRVAAAIATDQMNILASAAAQKLVGTPTEQAIRSYYNSNKGQFDSVQVSHILLAYAGGMAPPRPGTNAPSEAQAAAKAQAIVKQLRAGANFAQMAMQNSDDIASAERGGDLGTFGRGALPPEIEGHVFDLKDGQVSDPIPSRYGIHIFVVRKHGVQPIDQVRQAIARQVKQQNTLDRIEVLYRAAKIDFDPKFFPDLQRKPAAKKPS